MTDTAYKGDVSEMKPIPKCNLCQDTRVIRRKDVAPDGDTDREYVEDCPRCTDTARIMIACRDSSCVDSLGQAQLYVIDWQNRWRVAR